MKNTVQNTLQGRKQSKPAHAVFNPRSILLLIVLGVFSFGAYFTLSGFSGDLKNGNNGGAHALSKSATGYGGLLHLLKQNGNTVDLSRSYVLRDAAISQVRIVSLTKGWFSTNLEEMVIDTPTLIIMPKWRTRKHPKQKGWVQRLNVPNPDLLKLEQLSSLLMPVVKDIQFKRSRSNNEKIYIYSNPDNGINSELSFYNFEQIQTMTGDSLIPIITSHRGAIVSQVEDKEIYILSDPDFLNTFGVANPDRAEFAYGILQLIEKRTNANGYVFDISLHGFVRSQNLIKLALTPPFLAATLCLLAMGLLIAWQALSRFGDPMRSERNIAMGKLSLLLSAAGFINLAGREYKMAAEYAELTKKIAMDKLHIVSSLTEADKIQRLDTYSKHTGADENWSKLEAEKFAPKNATELMKNAQKLYKWRGDITHERN